MPKGKSFMEKSFSERLQDLLQSTLFWGSACMFATIVLTVVAVMIHDARWLLFVAWPFAGFAVWEFARLIFSRRIIVIAVTMALSLGSAALLGWLYIALVPAETPTASNSSEKEAPKRPTPLDSTWSRAYYKRKWDGVMPDQKTLEKNTAAFRQYIGVYADTLSAIAAFPAIKGGDKAQLIPSAATADAMGNFLEITFETRRLGKDLLGIFTAKYKQDLYGAVSSQKMLPGSDLEVKIRKRIEDLTGVARGDCELQ